jgi:hypothetical protein
MTLPTGAFTLIVRLHHGRDESGGRFRSAPMSPRQADAWPGRSSVRDGRPRRASRDRSRAARVCAAVREGGRLDQGAEVLLPSTASLLIRDERGRARVEDDERLQPPIPSTPKPAPNRRLLQRRSWLGLASWPTASPITFARRSFDHGTRPEAVTPADNSRW